jgi:hypothetical protein
MSENLGLSAQHVAQAARFERTAERSVRQSLERWLRAIVWSAALLFCLIVWIAVYVAAGGPLP